MNQPSAILLNRSRLRELSKIPDWDEKVYQTALFYAECGYYVIPVRSNSKKIPGGAVKPIEYADASQRAETIAKWYKPGKGLFTGQNIGIACGKEDGVFALDLDIKNDANGVETIKDLEAEFGELPAGPLQVTPHGGYHRLFRWQENAANSTSKLGQGIDTRGGTAEACKGHIVVWPSSVDGVRYKWVDFGEPPTAPDWLVAKLGKIWDAPSDRVIVLQGRGNENVTASDLENPVTSEQAEILLEHIDIDDIAYDDWLRIGMALKSEFPGDRGLELWESWSAPGARHQKGECANRWSGFAFPGAVRIGTLFHFARLGGWEHDPERDDPRKPSQFADLIEDMNNKYAVIAVGGKLRILRQITAMSHQHTTYDLLDKDTFKTFLQNKIVYTENVQGMAKPVSEASVWLSHPDRRDYLNGLGLFPEGAPEGYYNTWQGYAYAPVEGKCNLFIDLVHNGLCNGDAQLSEWLLDWCADLIQNPENLLGTCVVLKGMEGTGKGTFAKTLGQLFGPHFRHLIDADHLTSHFNGALMDAILVFADEITWGGNVKSAGKLRGLITERYLTGERKGVDAVQYRNMSHVIIASNSEWVIPAGQNSRRWFVLEVSHTNANSLAYFNALHRQLDNGGYEALLYFLQHRKITSNLRFAPVTEALEGQRQISAVFPTSAQWWLSILYRGFFLTTPSESNFEASEQLAESWPEHVQAALMYAEYEDWCYSRKATVLSLKVFLKHIQAWGLVSHQKRFNGKRLRVMQMPKLGAAISTLDVVCPGLVPKELIANE